MNRGKRSKLNVKGKVKKEKKTLTFNIDDRTKITRTKKELNMANLKNGMNVLVECKKEGVIAQRLKQYISRVKQINDPTGTGEWRRF